jgi:hypothetical protein
MSGTGEPPGGPAPAWLIILAVIIVVLVVVMWIACRGVTFDPNLP